MSTRKPDDEALESFADAFKELMELQQQIDESARSIVESVRTTVDHRSDYLAVRAADYPNHDAGYYDGTGKELAAEGIAALGDFEDATFSRRNPDKHVFVRLGLAKDGTVGAMWFRLGTASSVSVHSWLEDGRTITTFRAATESAVPVPGTSLSERVPLETSVRDLVRRHRSRVRATAVLPRQLGGIDDLIAALAADESAVAEFREREGIALFEPMLRQKLGERYEEEGAPLVESIRAHPEWWTGEEKAEQAGDGGFHMMFLRSAETSGRWHFTTAGLAMFGLPELQMKEVAGNHCRAARFLMAVVARKLRDGATGPELVLGLADVPHPNVFLTRPDEVKVDGEARVLLVPEGFGDEAPDVAGLIRLMPPSDYRGDKDQWLRESCRCLGQDAPKALDADQFEIAMAAASRKAKGTLAALRPRFREGLSADEQFLIKVGLDVPTGGREFVWVSVREWSGGMLVGTLETEPHNVPGIKQGQDMRVAEGDVFDRTIYSRERGIVEIAMTDVVAQEFGVDA
jgi:uncharacterized protein YegJ (DUF2314 family)